MHITCKQQDLSRGLSIVSHAVSSRSTLPILTNILLATDQGHLKLAATNLEISITCWIDAEVQEEGTTTVPTRPFTELVNSLAAGQVELSIPAETNTLNIKSPGSNANIKGVDASEFPIIPGADGGEQPIVLDASLLKEMIAQVVFAAANDDSRPVFTAILAEVESEKVTFAAADSFRLALRVASLPAYTGTLHSMLIPAKTMSELARILPTDGTVQMIVTPNRNQVLFHTEQVDLVSRLIEGTFPNVRATIPKQHTTQVIVNTKAFAAALKRVAPFARDSSNITRVKINNDGSGSGATTEPGTITLESNAEDVGDNTVTIDASVNGPELQIILNVRYLSEVLAVLDSSEVALELISATSPAVVRPAPIGETDYVCVIMPMSINR
jgi:DNA polymerase III subunit beta